MNGKRTVFFVTPDAIELVEPAGPYPEGFGSKACGLLSVPAAWVPNFVVMSGELSGLYFRSEPAARSELIDSWCELLVRALKRAGLEAEETLYLRSNARDETLDERGKYQSIPCERANLRDGLMQFFEVNGSAEGGQDLGLVVQAYIRPFVIGRFSNARRVVEEYREALVEVEDVATGAINEERIAHKRWRYSRSADTGPLICNTEGDLWSALRQVLIFFASLRRRVLAEWVWDGKVLYIVQVDTASDEAVGVKPPDLIEAGKRASANLELAIFRRATVEDGERYRKIANHFLYEELGFRQPPLYLLSDPAVMRDIVAGSVPAAVRGDLETLTTSPLVIRTASSRGDITLLPRSDTLKTVDDAVAWMLETFRVEVQARGLDPVTLAFVAHHYIAATAAAFSASWPDSREVLVEALWGIPEGLYYFPHDVYRFDSGVRRLEDLDRPTLQFAVDESPAFKGHFVAPSPDGRFVVHRTARPWDWKTVIADNSVLREMSHFSRRLALVEGRPVKVMWFLECAEYAGLPYALPWYHDGEVSDRGASEQRQRSSRDRERKIRTEADLLVLESEDVPEEGASGAVIVQLDPIEDKIIRNQQFADRVGRAANRIGAIVELGGGQLSHVYYTLQRSGARVTLRQPRTFSNRTRVFDKLVRDGVPDVVAQGGERASVTRLNPANLKGALKIKLVEEAFEVRDADDEVVAEELADVLEVVHAIAASVGKSFQEIEEIRTKKRERRGGFDEGVVLRETSLEPAGGTDGLFGRGVDTGVVRHSDSNVPLESVRDGTFDVRFGYDFIEFLQTAYVGITFPSWSIISPKRVNTSFEGETIEWAVEATRVPGARLQVKVRVRFGNRQLSLPFE